MIMNKARPQQNPQNDKSVQQRWTSACTSAQSDRSYCCPYKEALCPWICIERPAKTYLIVVCRFSYRILIQAQCKGVSHAFLHVQYYQGFSHLIKYETVKKKKFFTVIYRYWRMGLEGRLRNINSWRRSRSELIFTSAPQHHALISDKTR